MATPPRRDAPSLRPSGADASWVRSAIASPPAPPTPLRIAVLAPIAWRTPPVHYGPWELFASLLADGLAALGHDVTLFATADSVTAAALHAPSPPGWSDDPTHDPKVTECPPHSGPLQPPPSITH